MSDTPETDAAVNASGGDWSPVLRAVSQRLERERDEARIDRANGDIATMTINHYERILRERDEALKKIKKQKLEIVRLNGATNHAGGTPLKIALRERDEARAIAYDLASVASHCLGWHDHESSEAAERIADTLKIWRSTQPCKK